jgi:hypothetical protein
MPGPFKSVDALTDTIQKAIEIRKNEIIAEEAKKAAEIVENRVREYVGQIASHVANRISYECYGTELVIKVQFENKGK